MAKLMTLSPRFFRSSILRESARKVRGTARCVSKPHCSSDALRPGHSPVNTSSAARSGTRCLSCPFYASVSRPGFYVTGLSTSHAGARRPRWRRRRCRRRASRPPRSIPAWISRRGHDMRDFEVHPAGEKVMVSTLGPMSHNLKFPTSAKKWTACGLPMDTRVAAISARGQ